MPNSAAACLIYNPRSGNFAPSPTPLATFLPAFAPVGETVPPWLEAARAHLRVAFGTDAHFVAAESFEQMRDAARDAANAGSPLVIAAGGDGTVRAVAEGLAQTKTPLGILPRGTANVLARELNLPQSDMQKALEICTGGVSRAIDMGRIGDRYFLLMASVGFDALAIENVDQALKGAVGVSAYWVSGFATLASFTPPELTLTLDNGETRRSAPAFMAVVANTAKYGGSYHIAPDAILDDGLLDVCVFEAGPNLPVAVQRATFAGQMGAMVLGRHRLDPDVRSYRARRIEIVTDPPVLAQVDGDALGTTPLVIEVAPRALLVRVPA